MWKVDVYLETDSAYQGKTYRKCGYVLSTFLRSGDEWTRQYFGNYTGTYHQTVLRVIDEALSRMNFPVEICVHTQDIYAASRLSKLEKMVEDGWCDAKGNLIKNAQEWQQVYRNVHKFSEPHKVSAISGKHNSSMWLQEMMKKDECKRIIGTGLEPETRPESGNNGVSGNVCP